MTVARAVQRPMPFAEYAEIPAVNWSSLRNMAASPLLYRHRLETERPDTEALKRGRAVHCGVFEPERLPIDFTVYTKSKTVGEGARKDWQAFKEAAAREGKTVLDGEAWAKCCEIGSAVRAHRRAAALLKWGIAEHVIRWTDSVTGIACKGRCDWVGDALVDLKTTRTIEGRAFGVQALRLSFHAQLAFYADGIRTASGEVLPVKIIAVESEAPYDVAVVTLGEDDLACGRAEYQRLLARLAECRTANRWPGRYEEETPLELPPWAWPDEGNMDDLMIGGTEDAR